MQVWPIALAIAQFTGSEAMHNTLRQLLDKALVPGSATHIFSLLATQSYESVASSMQQAITTPAVDPDSFHAQVTSDPACQMTTPMFSPSLSGIALTTLVPAVAGAEVQLLHIPAEVPTERSHLHTQPPQPGGMMFHSNWRKSLLILAANRSAGDLPALAALGDKLWAAKVPELVTYAHVCYILAGKPLGSAADPSCTFVVPGIDHTAAMGMCGRIDSLQRTELLAWCHMQRHGAPMYCVIPSYIMVSN